MIECKGWSPRATLTDDKFKRWLQHNVPVAFAATKTHPDWRNFAPHFELWTTAVLSDEASELFESASAQINPDRYTIGLRLNEDLRSAFRGTRDDSFLTAFERHYTPPLPNPGPDAETARRGDAQGGGLPAL